MSFVEKYRRGWVSGLPETPCGSGSRLVNTLAQRQWIPEIARKYGISTVADIGAGDLNWALLMDWDVQYTPYDLVPRHPSVKMLDVVQECPRADMLMCLWVLNHFPPGDCVKAIANIKASGSKYLLMTDRPSWHGSQPDEIQMPHIEALDLDGTHRMLLIDLQC